MLRLRLCAKELGGLGFKDLEAFNQAFLAKQGWRVLKNPDLLFSKVLKEAYFKNCSFLEAKYWKKASYVWRSLIWGKELLKRGYCWRVGLGENIGVLDDYWLFGKNGIGFTNPLYIPNDVSAADLRLADGKWSKDFLEMLFTPNNVLRILSLPMGSMENDDELI